MIHSQDNNLIEKALDNRDIQKYHQSERTEEVKDIIERMPTKFGYGVSAIVLLIFLFILFFGFTIRYPDIVQGKITINTLVAPIKLIANSSGKIKLNAKTSQSFVNNGDIVAYIENPASLDTLLMIKKILKNYNPNDSYNTSILSLLPPKAPLGELNSQYYNFFGSLHQMANFNNDRIYDKQIKSLKNLHEHQLNEINASSERVNITNNALNYSKKFLKRDSILYASKVATEAELDRAKMDYLGNVVGSSNARSGLIDAEKQAQQTLSKVTEVDIQKIEKRKELEVALLASYNELMDNIASWEQKYLFKAPFNGTLQFLQFWTNDQFVQTDQPVFTIVPDANEPYGQVNLPAVGAGKVKVGQEVIVKLDDFPYNEYGSVKGKIENISLTTNTEKTEKGSIETYLVVVKFPKGLVTNYGKKLSFRHESKGTAEVIAKDRKLIERLFDNLHYVLKK